MFHFLFQILNVSVVHIIPVINPDGASVASEGNCNNTVGKYNARKVDLLSNFNSMLLLYVMKSFFHQHVKGSCIFIEVQQNLCNLTPV